MRADRRCVECLVVQILIEHFIETSQHAPPTLARPVGRLSATALIGADCGARRDPGLDSSGDRNWIVRDQRDPAVAPLTWPTNSLRDGHFLMAGRWTGNRDDANQDPRPRHKIEVFRGHEPRRFEGTVPPFCADRA